MPRLKMEMWGNIHCKFFLLLTTFRTLRTRRFDTDKHMGIDTSSTKSFVLNGILLSAKTGNSREIYAFRHNGIRSELAQYCFSFISRRRLCNLSVWLDTFTELLSCHRYKANGLSTYNNLCCFESLRQSSQSSERLPFVQAPTCLIRCVLTMQDTAGK